MPTPSRGHRADPAPPPGVAAVSGDDDGAGGLDDEAIEELEALYTRLPALACRGLCADSCSRRVDASTLERERIAAGIDLDAPTTDGACPALSRALVSTGVCTVHAIRPMVCRLWAAAASMLCPHGCTPAGEVLDEGAVLGLLAASLDVGGHPGAGLRELLEVCMADPHAAALMSARLRGNRGVEPALAARLRHLRSQHR